MSNLLFLIALVTMLTTLDTAPVPQTHQNGAPNGTLVTPIHKKKGKKAGAVEVTNAGKAKRCRFRPFIAGGAKIAIWAKDLKLVSHWTRSKYSGITWRVDGGLAIDPPGSGTICAKFSPAKPGRYAFTLVSVAPHAHDHNDAWVKLGSDFMLYRAKGNRTMVGNPRKWYKAFQNEGPGKVAHHVLTKDNDGHQFIVGPLQAGGSYSVCVAGRSSRFTVKKLVFVRCPGDDISECDRETPFMERAMNWLPPSPCV